MKRDHKLERNRTETNPGTFWLYGIHAARAALVNPRRTIVRAMVTEPVWRQLEGGQKPSFPVEISGPDKIGQVLPNGAVHQGVALLCEPLPALDLGEFLEVHQAGRRHIAVLDQITDPHNEGAILRSADAFGFRAVIVQSRHSPPESGVLAKAASGALDLIARIEVVNISRALEEIGRAGIWRIALTDDGEEEISDAASSGEMALVLGAEGTGLRRLVRERCDASACIAMLGSTPSLNVSNAAAIAFYEISRSQARE
jgi:23S rRNA (guanosine2251-2'-O)-methyltransferase